MTEPFDDEMPDEIRQLIGQCEVGMVHCTNDEMSVALKFGELLWRKLAGMAGVYERAARRARPGDARRRCTRRTEDMRKILADVKRELRVK